MHRTYICEKLHMGEFVVGCRRLENNLLFILPIDLRVLRLEEHQFIICNGAFQENYGDHSTTEVRCVHSTSFGHSNYFTDLGVECRT